MINSFLFNTGSENTGSLIQVIESGSIGSNNLTGDTGVVSSDYNPSFSNLQTNDLILIIGSGQQVNAPVFFQSNDEPPERVQTNFVVPEGFTSILEKPIDDFNTKATSFISYRTIPVGETSYQVELTPSTVGNPTRSTVYNYFILRGVNPEDPYSLILSSSNDDIGNINIEDSQAIIYSLYYQSSSFFNDYTEDQTPPTSSLNPDVNLNGSQPPNSFSSSIAAGALNQGVIPFVFGATLGEIKTQALVHSAFKKFDEATTFNPDAFSFSNGHAGGKSTTAIVFNNTLDIDPPIKTHIVPTSSFEVNTTTGTGSWNPPPNGNNAFYDNSGIKSLNFYYKFAYADNFTSVPGTTGSGYEEPILAGTSNMVSFLENGFQKPLSTQGYYTGYYTAVDKFGNESVPADQVDTFLLTGFNAPVPEITQNGSTGFNLAGSGGGVQTTVSLSNLQVDDLVLVFAYAGDNTNQLGVRENPDDFATVSLNGVNLSNGRFKSFYRFASSTSMDIQFYRVNSTVANDVIAQYFVIRGVRTDEPFHSFVFRQGDENGDASTNILTFPPSSGILGESFNSLVLSIAGVRGDNTANRTPVIQGNVNNSLQLLNGSPDSVNRSFNDIVFAAYGQEDPSSANVNDIGYPLRTMGRSAAGVLYINPSDSLNSTATPTTSGVEIENFNIETTSVQLVGAS